MSKQEQRLQRVLARADEIREEFSSGTYDSEMLQTRYGKWCTDALSAAAAIGRTFPDAHVAALNDVKERFQLGLNLCEMPEDWSKMFEGQRLGMKKLSRLFFLEERN